MNIDPRAITVLCFGDSNTHGTKPDKSGRFNAMERWTGLLQQTLGDAYYVIEEGLGGRTTDLESPDTAKPSRNGYTYFTACVESHMPLDYIVIMLGTNDFKSNFNRSPSEVADALSAYPKYVRAYATTKQIKIPRIIFLNPAYINSSADRFIELMSTPGAYDGSSATKSHELGAQLEQMAKDNKCGYIDAAGNITTGEDGLHLTKKSHENVAEMVYSFIKESK